MTISVMRKTEMLISRMKNREDLSVLSYIYLFQESIRYSIEKLWGKDWPAHQIWQISHKGHYCCLPLWIPRLFGWVGSLGLLRKSLALQTSPHIFSLLLQSALNSHSRAWEHPPAAKPKHKLPATPLHFSNFNMSS